MPLLTAHFSGAAAYAAVGATNITLAIVTTAVTRASLVMEIAYRPLLICSDARELRYSLIAVVMNFSLMNYDHMSPTDPQGYDTYFGLKAHEDN